VIAIILPLRLAAIFLNVIANALRLGVHVAFIVGVQYPFMLRVHCFLDPILVVCHFFVFWDDTITSSEVSSENFASVNQIKLDVAHLF